MSDSVAQDTRLPNTPIPADQNQVLRARLNQVEKQCKQLLSIIDQLANDSADLRELLAAIDVRVTDLEPPPP